MTKSFLGEGYEVPKTAGNYMKFQKGANKFRVLSDAITGWEYWTNDNKPVRSPEPFTKIPKDVRTTEENPFKHFWAFVVWNYQDEKVQILEITQKGIQKAIKSYLDNPDWGSPKNYDITVSRSGEGFDTEYSVMPSPSKPLTDEIRELYRKSDITLEALFKGQDPFKKASIEYPENNAGEIPF